jgi:hypothetical protein
MAKKASREVTPRRPREQAAMMMMKMKSPNLNQLRVGKATQTMDSIVGHRMIAKIRERATLMG